MRTEDGYIINKCLNGEKEAFGFLVDKYRESIYAFAYTRLRNSHDAEDITQEVFLKAFKNLRTLRQWDNFLAWLYAITSNLCKNFLRSQSNRPDREFIAEQDAGLFDYLSMNFYQEQQAYEALYEVLDSMPEIYREVLTLYYLGRMSTEEIARFLGASPAAIRQRLNRARMLLKEEMLEMMDTAFESKKLQPGFTFRIVEMVKHIKIKSAPRSTPLLPFGLSATGIVLTVLMFSSHLISLTPLGALLGSPLPGETKVMEYGELPVDVLEISEITFLSSEQGDGNDRAKKLPDQQNAFAPPLAPSGGEGTWTKRADMPTARYCSVCEVNGKIYAIGGSHWHGIFAIVEEYDPATDTWTKKSDMPTARYGLSACVLNGKIYAIGGINGVPLSTLEEYDPAKDKWTKKADMPTPRYGLCASAANGKIYVIGGSSDPNWWNNPSRAVEEYDAMKDVWTKKADMPQGRVFADSSVVSDKIYVIGGGNEPSLVEEYDPVVDKWIKKTDMPTGRIQLSTCAVFGKIYAIGGREFNPVPVPFSTLEMYEPLIDKWTKKKDMPTARFIVSSASVNGKIYAIGGAPDSVSALSTVEEYDTGITKNISPKGKLPSKWGEIKCLSDKKQ